MKRLLKSRSRTPGIMKYPRIVDSLLLVAKMGKLLGMFPVKSIYEDDGKSSNFKSCNFICSGVIWFVDFVVVILTIADWLYIRNISKFEITSQQLGSITSITTHKLTIYLLGYNVILVDLVFNSEIFFSLSFFIYFTKKWPGIICLWNVIDQRMDLYDHPKNFNIKINILLIIYCIMSVGNHVGSPMHSVVSLFDRSSNETIEFSILPEYSNFFSKLLTLHSVLGKTAMHYRDIFLIITALVLREKFKQINGRIKKNRESICIEFWKEIREEYDRLAQMVRVLDKDLGFLTIVAAGYNGFWILNFFYRSYRAQFSSTANLYFFYPFAYILLRFFAMFLSGAYLNDESIKPFDIIQFADLPTLNVEISRLLTQIEFDSVFLSGYKIFKMKRGIILSVLGAIVTYELTLLQYGVFGAK